MDFSAAIIIGINRYIHANPFYLIFLCYIFKGDSIYKTHRNLVVMSIIVLFLITKDENCFVFPELALSLGILGIFSFTKDKFLGYALIIVFFAIQCSIFSTMMSGIQVD